MKEERVKKHKYRGDVEPKTASSKPLVKYIAIKQEFLLFILELSLTVSFFRHYLSANKSENCFSLKFCPRIKHFDVNH